MALHRILVASKSFGYGADKEQLFALFESFSLQPTFLPLRQALESIAEFDGIIIGTDPVTSDLLRAAKRLRVVVKYGVGTDNIDAASAREHRVLVRNLPGINSTTVAEMALGLMLAVARQIARGDRTLRRGERQGLIGVSVVGKTLGIIGTGAIGCALARLVLGLEMTVLGYDIVENSGFTAAGGRYLPLDRLLESSNFVSLHLPLLPETTHFINEARLACMRQGAILINTSRGKIVDEPALARALTAGRLGGAGLDVFEAEPSPAPELLALENVVLTPHIAAYAEETLRRMDEACLRTLAQALNESEEKQSYDPPGLSLS